MTQTTDSQNKKNTHVIVNAAKQARGTTERDHEPAHKEVREPDFFERLNCFA